MRRLMLLRHAKSDWTGASRADRERPLNARGRESAARMGAYMARHGLLPERALVSTAVRARQTYELAVADWKQPPPPTSEERIYEADVRTMLAAVKETPAEVHSLLMVGHNPGLQQFALHLIASGDDDLRQQIAEKFPTAALAVIEFPIDAWAKLHAHSGRLARLVTPRALMAELD